MDGPIDGNGSGCLLHDGLCELSWQLKQLYGSQRGGVFVLAVGIAAVGADAVAVVTLFSLLGIDNAVPTTGKAAVGAAEGVRGIAVSTAGVALFACINNTVSAEGRRKAAILRATVGQGCVVDRRLALLVKKGLDDAVAADTELDETIA